MLRVAVVVDSMVQFLSVERGLGDLSRLGVSVEVYVPQDSGLGDSAETTLKGISELGYSPRSGVEDGARYYDVLLECYPLSDLPSMVGIQWGYRIKFQYFLLAAKPNQSYTPNLYSPYDATIVFSAYEASILQVYGRTHLVAPPKFSSYSREELDTGERPTLVYLPTFGDDFSSDYERLAEVFTALKADYRLVIKLHSATQFSDHETAHREFLVSIADDLLSQSANLVETLQNADVVLAGGSAAVFDALYAEVPVCVASKEIDRYKLLEESPLYQFIAEGFIPLASTPEAIPEALKEARRLSTNQRMLTQREFFPEGILVGDFASVVADYAKSDSGKDPYLQMRQYYLQCQEEERQAYETSLSWRLTRFLRAIAGWVGR